ncbi:hypothetical protein VRU48_05235 [Pedobacter sp. KR3-3]|uniref:Uncharacterized protein n=1 Tax=Pedobacter albus TaxID=3113905 RepID=A0ABU7I5B1_9SPHI|nr:hypothetical protein [Pedobacter sp. KR3-3]MEE1944501.1 hypothetical protein [Pedobacter sp. KR3-3]
MIINSIALNATEKYGINERSKAELDALSNQVNDAEHDVEQLQAVVNSLNDKSIHFQGFLNNASSSKAQTLSNKTLLDQILQNALSLKENSKIALDEIAEADQKTIALSAEIKLVIDKLIYSATVIDKLRGMVLRAKSLIPYINDDVLQLLADAGTDANNAVGLALVALKSTLAAETANAEAEAASSLEYLQAVSLYEVLTIDQKEKETGTSQDCLKDLINAAYETAVITFDNASKASTETNHQLNKAKADLAKAQIKLKSLQLSLAAGTAAILSA